LAVGTAENITLQGVFNSPSKAVDLVASRTSTSSSIDIGAAVTAGSLQFYGGNTVNISGAISAGIIDGYSGNISVTAPLTTTGSIAIQADDNLSIDANVTTGTGTGAYALLQATSGELGINSAVTSSNGAVTLSGLAISGPGLITARMLSVQEGGGAVDYALNANVSNLSGNTASNLSFTNLRDLTIGDGALNLRGNATTLVIDSPGNLNVAGNIVMQNPNASATVVLSAGTSVAIAGVIQPSNNPIDLTVTAANGTISATTSINLNNGNAVFTATGNVTIPSLVANHLDASTANGSITITETNGMVVDNATVSGSGNITLVTLAGDLTVSGISRIGSAGTATLQSNKGNIAIDAPVFTPSTGNLVLNASNGVITNGTDGAIATGNLTWIALRGHDEALLKNDSISNYSGLSANITGNNNVTGDLVVQTGRSLTLGNITTRHGDVTVSVTNVSGSPNLTIFGNVTAGNAVPGPLQNIVFTASNGAINSTGLITGNVLTLTALNSTSLTRQNVSQLNATITGAAQNLSVSSSRSMRAGDITLTGGTLNVTLTGGNLTRSGTIDTGTNGTAILNVAQGSILGNGLIASDSLNFAAVVAPNLSERNTSVTPNTGATFTRLSANITQAGNLSLTRASNLIIDQAVTAFGDISINLGGGPLGTNLTLNGPLTAGGNGNITLNAANGSVNTASGALGTITANVLNVTSLNDIVLQTNVAQLTAKVTAAAGNITVTESNGLIVGSGNITANNNIAITLLAGDLTRTGAINASTANGNVTLNIVGGGVTGNGAINTSTLNWISQSNATISDTFLNYSKVAANVTGAGNDLVISRTGNYTVLGATTTSGNVSIASTVGGLVTSGNLAINGPIAAGGGKSVVLSAVAGSVTSSNASAVINTTGNVSLLAQNTSTIYTSVAGLAANVTAGDLTVNEANGLTLLAGTGNNVTASGNVTLSIGTSMPGNLSGSGYLNAGKDVTITATNGAVTLSSVANQVNAGDLSITAKDSSSANTNVTNLTANITAGGLTIVEANSVTIEPTDVIATGAISITSTAGTIAGSANGGISTTGDVTLSAANGAVQFTNNANQIIGNVLTINAKNSSAVNTFISGVAANVTAGDLTVNEANGLNLLAGTGNNITASGNVTLNVGTSIPGNLTGSGYLNAGQEVTITALNGSVNLSAVINQVNADNLSITAKGNSTANTNVTNLTANITAGGLTIVEADDVTIEPTDVIATGAISITSTAGTIAGSVNGGINTTANVTLSAANGGVQFTNNANQIVGNVLSLTAKNNSAVNTSVSNLVASVVAGDLTVNEANDLAVGINTTTGVAGSGNVSIKLATGNLTGLGSINASAGTVTLTTAGGGVTLSNATQSVRGNLLNLTAQNDVSVSTNVAQLTANIIGQDETLTIREAAGLTITASGVVTNDGLIDIATATGTINGTGSINSGSNDITLSAVAGNVVMTNAANQVSGTNLTVVANGTSSLKTHVVDLNAVITAGGLTVTEFDDLEINLGNVTANGVISLTAGNAATVADITGDGTINAAGGRSDVMLSAAGGKVVLTATSGQIVGSTLTLTANDASSLNTEVANLVANVTAGGLTVSEADSLNIGTNTTSNVVAAGDISITLDSGSLAGNGTINANAGADNITLILAGSGNVSLNAVANQVIGNVLNVSATSGAVNLNSAANTATVQTNDLGVAINQSQSLTINAIVADGNVNIAISTGDLQIDSGSILGAQLSNLTLNVADGAINSVDLGSTGNLGVVFGNVLDIRAKNSSDMQTSVTSLTANVTGDAQSLTITDSDDPTDDIANGLTIGANGVLTNGGDVAINVMTIDDVGSIGTAVANLVGTGNVSTLNTTNNVAGNITINVTNGSATFSTRAGQVTGNVLAVAVVNNSTINSNVSSLDQFDAPTGVAISGLNQILTINELNNLAIGPGDIKTSNGSDLVINVGGSLTVSATGGALIADDLVTKGNITLNASQGAIGSPSAEINVTANVLTINRAQNDVYLNTTINQLTANVTSGQLSVVESDDLNIGAISANGISINADGMINGSGIINSAAGAGNVNLVADSLSLNAVNQVVANVLNVTVINTSTLYTRVNTLAAAVTGPGENLNVTEADNLNINASVGDITANGGDLRLTLNSGSLTGNGAMNADTGDIYLNASAGSINVTGTLASENLDVRSLGNSSVTTAVGTLTANVTSGSLTVSERDDITIGATNVAAFGGVAITAGGSKASGSIDGTGYLCGSSGNVSLSTPNGAVNLTAKAGQVMGGALTLNASNTSSVNANVSTLVANITGANSNLIVTELNSLAIGAGNVVTKSGDITITTGGDLSRAGNITAGSKAPSPGADVILNVSGATTGTGVITADTLNLTAVNSSSLNTSINTLIATITRDGQTLSVFETAGLNIDGGNVSTVNGSITLNVATGDLKVTGALTAGTANVTLNVLTGGIDASSGNIAGNVLSVLAANASKLDTAVNSVVANITGAGNSLNIVDIDSLSIGTGGLQTNNGAINVAVGDGGLGSLTIGNPINSGTANVTLTSFNGAINGTANGLVTGNVLNVVVMNSSTLTTNVTTLMGGIMGTNQTLTITETSNGLQIGAANLAASGANSGINLTVANGSLSGSGSIVTTNGPITIAVSNGNLNTTGSINAGAGNLAFNVNGVITLTAANQVSGNTLSLVANGASALNTVINSIVANVTGAGNTLSVTDADALSVGSGEVITNNANITLASGTYSAGDLLINGQVSAGNKTVSLSANGGINGSGLVTASNLTAVSVNNVVLATNVANLAAVVSGSAQTLKVNETNGLNVANVIATNGTTINGITLSNGATAVTLNVAAGSIGGNAVINAGASGNVTLRAPVGAITLNNTKQITGNVLNVTAANSSLLNTDLRALTGQITGNAQTLTVTENAGLALSGIQTNNGDLSINTATGNFTGAGLVNVGTANVTLTAATGGIALNGVPGQVTANALRLLAATNAVVNTNVTSLAANVTSGPLDVFETNGLSVLSGDVLKATGNVSVTLTNGSLVGDGSINSTSGNVRLNAAAGAINLASSAGQVSAANLLDVTAATSSLFNTSVANLTATITNGSLTITEANGLNIAGTGVNTSTGAGNVALTLTAGSLNGAGVINAGSGNVAITAVAGNVTLNQASPPPQVIGNVLTLTTSGQANVDTNVNALSANVTSTGSLTISELNNLSVNLARTSNGAINISAGNTSTLSVYNITSAAGPTGTVTLAAGTMLVYSPGITATGTLNISGVGNTTVVNGTITGSPTVIQTSPVNWLINANATGSGSLNQVITNINNFNGNSAVNVTTATTVNLTSQLPTIRKSLSLAGNNLLTLNGTSAGASSSGLTLGFTGIKISGVTLNNFGGAGIDILNLATNSSVSGVIVQNSAIGLRATGNVSGSVVTSSTFNGQNRANSNGAVLSSAQGLQLGQNTSSYNTFRNSTVGMTAAGVSTGTKVYGNLFTTNSRYGISLAAATGIQIGDATNLALRNTVSGGGIGVFASGFCTSSSVNKTVFVTFTGTQYSVAQSRNLTVVK